MELSYTKFGTAHSKFKGYQDETEQLYNELNM